MKCLYLLSNKGLCISSGKAPQSVDDNTDLCLANVSLTTSGHSVCVFGFPFDFCIQPSSIQNVISNEQSQFIVFHHLTSALLLDKNEPFE